MIRIAPSVLAADFSDLYGSVQEVCQAEILHFDVMDGHFVPNISFGPPIICSLRNRTDVYFDTHLMVEQPNKYLNMFADAGSDRLTVHIEAIGDARSVIDTIHDLGLDAGIAINPTTPVKAIEHLLDDVETVLIMTVEPGFGGQEFMPETIKKVGALNKQTNTEIAVDGGIGPETGRDCVRAGANTLIVGTSLFDRSNVSAAFEELQHCVRDQIEQ